MKKLVGLQYLRAIAALGVVVGHASGRYGEAWIRGVAGVDLFFVISGFIMILITGPNTRPRNFAFDRITRIVPLYWLATSVMLLAALAGLFPSVTLRADYVISSYFFIPSRATGSPYILPLVPQGWTLNCEMMFYATMLCMLMVRERHRLPIMTALFAVLVLLGAVISSTDPLFITWTNPIILEFIAGGWLAMLWRNRKSDQYRLGWCLIALGVVSFLGIPDPSEGADRVIKFGIPAICLLYGVLIIEPLISQRLKSRPLLFLGDASYSIYMWHTFIISISIPVLKTIGVAGTPAICTTVAAALIGGGIAHLIIERPLLKLVRQGHQLLTQSRVRVAR